MSKWEKVKLGEVCDVRDGTHDSPKYVSSGYPLITSKNISNGYIDLSEVNYISKEDYEKINARSFVDNGDILMPMIGTIGNPIVVDKQFDFAIKNVALVKFYNEKVENSYIYYLLRSDIFIRYINKENRGGTQKFLSLGSIRNFEIPFPPLEVQKQIAQNLDIVSELLALLKKQLEELDWLIKSVFYDMFGDPVSNTKGFEQRQLSDLAEIIMGQSPPGDSYNSNGNGAPLLNGPTEFGARYPVEKQWTTKPTKLCKEYDILFCVRGATAGRMNTADKEYCLGRGLAAIRPLKNSVKEFLYLYLSMMYSYFQNTSNGSTFINISKEQLLNLKILSVDTALQNQFASIVTKIEEQKALVKQSIQETQTLFDSLMSQYFD